MFGGKGGAGSFNVYDTYEERLGWEESSIYTQKKAEWKFVSALLLYFFYIRSTSSLCLWVLVE